MLPSAPIWRRSPRLGKRTTPHLQALCVLKRAGAARPPAGRDTPWRGYGFFRRAHVSMPEDSLHQPHDKLFRATFSDPRNAAAFLCHHLGGPLPALVHRGSPSLCEKDSCGSGSAENQIKQLVLDLRTDLEFLAGKQPNAAVGFNAGVPSFGEGAKDRPQGDGAGEGKSGYAPPEGAEGGSVRVSVRRIHLALSTAFPLQGVFRQAARQLGEGALE